MRTINIKAFFATLILANMSCAMDAFDSSEAPTQAVVASCFSSYPHSAYLSPHARQCVMNRLEFVAKTGRLQEILEAALPYLTGMSVEQITDSNLIVALSNAVARDSSKTPTAAITEAFETMRDGETLEDRLRSMSFTPSIAGR